MCITSTVLSKWNYIKKNGVICSLFVCEWHKYAYKGILSNHISYRLGNLVT